MRAQVELIKSSLKQLLREPMELLVILVFPVIFVVLFGLVFSGVDEEIQYSVGMDGQGSGREAMEAYFGGSDTFNIVDMSGVNLDEVLEEVDIALLFDEGMKMTVYTKDNDTGNILRILVANAVNQMTIESAGIQPIINTDIVIQKNPSENALDSIIPGILAIVIMQSGLFGALKIATQKNDKTLRNLSITPLKRYQYIGAELLVRVLVAFVQAIIVLGMGALLFDFRLDNILGLQLIFFVLLGAAAFISMGYCIVAWAPSAESANGIIQIIQLFMMFLSGVFVSGDLLPDFAATIVRYNPVAFLADGLRSSILQIQGVHSLPINGLVLALVVLVFSGFALRYRWD